ncbi:MAG: type II secretion system F family protein [Planctomycetota bacterium]|nr:type II secretion system F family protein [Planctomycetota bacterium]
MPEFTYTAKSQSGDSQSGTIAAASRVEAMRLLRQQSLFPLKVNDAAVGPGWANVSLPTRVKKEQIADFCSQLADLLGGGVPILESLRILEEATENPTLRQTAQNLHSAISEGDTLDVAMSRETRVFSDLTVSMVRAGQEGAFLEEALQRTALFLTKQDEMRAKIVGALTYPIILGVVGTLITCLMVMFMVPKFQPFFDRLEQNGTGLPAITVVLLVISHAFLNYGVFLLIAIMGLVGGMHQLFQNTTAKRLLDKWKLRLPVLGGIFHDSAVSRTCRVLGTLLRNGVPILKSLQISSESTGNKLLEEAILQSADNVTAGDSLSTPLMASKLIPKQVMAQIRVAEESNTLDDVLIKVADRTDEKIERRLEVLVRMIEPMMLILIGSMVMFVIVGVLLPVFEMNSSIG